MASSWEEYYGFKTEPFQGVLEDLSGATVDTRDDGIHGIGFGPGDLRKARRQGWTALAILDYLKGPTGSGGLGTHESSQYFKDTGGKAQATPQSVINELRQDEAIQNRMKTGWEKLYGDDGSLSGIQDISDTLGNVQSEVSTLSSGYDDLS